MKTHLTDVVHKTLGSKFKDRLSLKRDSVSLDSKPDIFLTQRDLSTFHFLVYEQTEINTAVKSGAE